MRRQLHFQTQRTRSTIRIPPHKHKMQTWYIKNGTPRSGRPTAAGRQSPTWPCRLAPSTASQGCFSAAAPATGATLEPAAPPCPACPAAERSSCDRRASSSGTSLLPQLPPPHTGLPPAACMMQWVGGWALLRPGCSPCARCTCRKSRPPFQTRPARCRCRPGGGHEKGGNNDYPASRQL